MQLRILKFKRSYLKLINSIKTIKEDLELKFHVLYLPIYTIKFILIRKKITNKYWKFL